MQQTPVASSRRQEFMAELVAQVTDPLHRRLLEAYTGDEPLKAMERTLREILTEMVSHEA